MNRSMLLCLVLAATPAPAVDFPDGPCIEYLKFLEEAISKREQGYPDHTYQSVPIEVYREGAEFVFAHDEMSAWQLRDWAKTQYDQCKSGEIDPYGD